MSDPVLSAGLIKVTNLSISGAQAGAIQVTNLAVENLEVSGDLVVSGNITNDALTTSLGLKAPIASPTFTGTVTAPNLIISGNITNASFTALNLQMQNTVMDAESIYYFFGSDASEYVPMDISGNIFEKNFFVCNYGFTNGGYQAIEFVYPTPSSVVPSSIYLTFYFNDQTILPGSKYMSDQNTGIRTPVSIPITTNGLTFGQAVINNVNSVFYDINKKQITINFVVENTWTESLNNTHTMESFKGSYAIVKKSQHTFINNDESESIFISCSPTDSAAFLMQVSPTVSIVDEYNLTVTPYTKNLCNNTTGDFQGYILTRPGAW